MSRTLDEPPLGSLHVQSLSLLSHLLPTADKHSERTVRGGALHSRSAGKGSVSQPVPFALNQFSPMSDTVFVPEAEELPSPRVTLTTALAPIVTKGKFFFTDGEKFFVKGVTYGPFAPASHGAPFPERLVMERDFTLMRELGANTLRTFTVPPRWLLDLAAEYGLRAIVGIPWAEHVAFLDSPRLEREIHHTIAEGVKACRGHAAVLACPTSALI